MPQVKSLPTYTASKDCKLLITIQKAANLPLRLQHDAIRQPPPQRFEPRESNNQPQGMRRTLDEFNDRDQEEEEETYIRPPVNPAQR